MPSKYTLTFVFRMFWKSSNHCISYQVLSLSGEESQMLWQKWCSPYKERRSGTHSWRWTEYIQSHSHTLPQVWRKNECLKEFLEMFNFVYLSVFIVSRRAGELHWTKYSERSKRLWNSDANSYRRKSTITVWRKQDMVWSCILFRDSLLFMTSKIFCFYFRAKRSKINQQLVPLLKIPDKSPDKGMAFSVSMRHAFVPFTGVKLLSRAVLPCCELGLGLDYLKNYDITCMPHCLFLFIYF